MTWITTKLSFQVPVIGTDRHPRATFDSVLHYSLNRENYVYAYVCTCVGLWGREREGEIPCLFTGIPFWLKCLVIYNTGMSVIELFSIVRERCLTPSLERDPLYRLPVCPQPVNSTSGAMAMIKCLFLWSTFLCHTSKLTMLRLEDQFYEYFDDYRPESLKS